MNESRIQTLSDWVGFSIFSSEVLISLCCLCYALVLIARQKNNTVPDVLVMHLCACELVAVIFGYCQECLYDWNAISNDDDTIYMLLYTAIYVSVYLSILVIVLDRVLAVYLVLKYKVIVTKKKVVVVYSVLWLIALATSILRYFTKMSPWLFLDNVMLAMIASCYLYIIISVYKRRQAMRRNNPHSHTLQLKYRVPLFIVCSFTLTILIPDLVYIFHPEVYCIWFQVIWTLNWISDPLVYVIYTKLQKKKTHRNQMRDLSKSKVILISQQNSRNIEALNDHNCKPLEEEEEGEEEEISLLIN